MPKPSKTCFVWLCLVKFFVLFCFLLQRPTPSPHRQKASALLASQKTRLPRGIPHRARKSKQQRARVPIKSRWGSKVRVVLHDRNLRQSSPQSFTRSWGTTCIVSPWSPWSSHSISKALEALVPLFNNHLDNSRSYNSWLHMHVMPTNLVQVITCGNSMQIWHKPQQNTTKYI